MKHQWVVRRETDTDVEFECSNCGTLNGFNKPGIGSPSAIPVPPNQWEAPPDADRYVGECQ